MDTSPQGVWAWVVRAAVGCMVLPAQQPLCGVQSGYTALMCAAGNGHLEVMTRLIEAGANVDLQNKVSPASTAPSGGVVAVATGVRVCGLGIGIRVKGRVLDQVRSGEVVDG